MSKKMVGLMGVVTLLAGFLAGCGSGDSLGGKGNTEPAKGKVENNEPITLKVYQNGLAVTDDDFTNFFVKPVSAKFPSITLELVRTADGSQPQDLIASGSFPDIIFAANPVFNDLKKLNVLADLNALIKKNNVNLAKFDPTTIDTIKLYGDHNEMYALPFSRNFGALFYNKDIFDKFGVPYPQDGMDWDQTIAIARKVARIADGIQYRGLEPGDMRMLGQSLSLSLIDPKTDQTTINNDGWKKVLTFIHEVYTLPNNLPPQAEFGAIRANFVQRKNVSMITDWINGISGELEKAQKQGQGLNWDVVSFPNFKEKLGTGRNVDIQSLLLSSTTKYKDQAFAVINLLTSEESQINVTRTGRLAAMNAPEIQKQYAADLESFKGKNIAGIFKTKPAKLNTPTDYDQLVYKFLTTATKRVGLNNEDINTVLRETEEDANKAIQADKNTRK